MLATVAEAQVGFVIFGACTSLRTYLGSTGQPGLEPAHNSALNEERR